MNNLLPIIIAIILIIIACLYAKGKEDAKKFDIEIKFVLWKIKSLPVELAYFRHLQNEFERLNKMPKCDREQIHVAWCEYVRRFMKFFPELGDETTIMNME